MNVKKTWNYWLIISCLILFNSLFVNDALVQDQLTGPESSILLSSSLTNVSVEDMQNYLIVERNVIKPEAVLADIKNSLKIAENIYLRKIYEQKALVDGLDKDLEIQQQISQEKQRILASDLNDKELKVKHIRQAILAKSYLNKQLESISEDSMYDLAYERYLLNPDDFKTVESIELSHILIATKNRDENEAKKMAEDLLEKIRNDSSRFEELAKVHSDDKGSGARGGKLPKSERKMFAPDFSKVAFALENNGDISDVVKTRYGYHIIRRDNYYPKKELSFEEAKPSLIASLLRNAKRDKSDAIKSQILTSAEITIHEEAFAELAYKARRILGEIE